MDVYVLDSNFKKLDVVDAYESIIWTTRYYTSGDFELYLPATNEYVALLQKNRYLCREQDIVDDVYKNVMIIKNIEVKTDIEIGDHLIVTGKSLKSIVSQRIIWQQTILAGYVERAIRTVISDNIISPAIAERKIENFELDTLQNFTESIDVQVTGTDIGTWLEEICKTYGMGWDVYIRNGKYVFTLWKGVDRSYNQDDVPHVVFSQEFDNLLTSDYMVNTENYKNVALVAGEGEGLNRKTSTVGTASGLDRYELYVDARDISSNDGEIDTIIYDAMLKERGSERLAENTVTTTADGEIAPETNYVINEDYFLGDIVQIVTNHTEFRCRITEIIDSEDINGRTVIPTYEMEGI